MKKILKRKEIISFMYFRDETPKDISEIKEENKSTENNKELENVEVRRDGI